MLPHPFQSSEPEPFTAKLHPPEQTEFKLEPSIGILPARVSEDDNTGSQPDPVITITYTPVRYGAPDRARLIVQTPNSEWHYQLIGDVPTYQQPEKSAAPSTTTAQEAHQRTRLLKRRKINFVQHNLHGGRSTTVEISTRPIK
ncbi:unnamed protein product [Echinostoma caproni]|uniref:ZU5 domain-containing protein n=1 Tax=Echinostoma caproni TaxID=27848 RepID=A0A183B7B2_9TREM|nr:unnamed protein product [Echinostoma caproni]